MPMPKYTHKQSGWVREAIGYGNYRIVPTDDSGIRTVAFMSANSWANLANDKRDDIGRDRVVLIDGPADWLDVANRKQCANGRAALRAAIDDADFNQDRRDSEDY